MAGPGPPDAKTLPGFQDSGGHDMGISSIGDFASGTDTSSSTDTSAEVKTVYFAWCQDCPHNGVAGAKVGPPRDTLEQAQQDAANHTAVTGHATMAM